MRLRNTSRKKDKRNDDEEKNIQRRVLHVDACAAAVDSDRDGRPEELLFQRVRL